MQQGEEVIVFSVSEDDDLAESFKLNDTVIPTARLMLALLRHARNDLNTRAYHRNGAMYYRGPLFEEHIHMLSVCFDVSGQTRKDINPSNARRYAESLLGLPEGYLDPEHVNKKRSGSQRLPGSKMLDLYRAAAKNKAIAEKVMSELLPGITTLDAVDPEILSDLEVYYDEQRLNIQIMTSAERNKMKARALQSFNQNQCTDSFQVEYGASSASSASFNEAEQKEFDFLEER